jgi:AAA family ATP:ADP antiporter
MNSMVSRLERSFGLRPGDLKRGSPLALYYFFILAAYTQGQVARDALFLGRFEAGRLPYVDFIIAAVVGGILAVYFRIGRMMSLINLLATSLCFSAVNVVLFWWVAHFRQSAWLYPVVYVWVGIFGVLAIAQVWTLANYVLTSREAKRLFGFIGTGGIIGGIFGGFSSNIVAERMGAESLLLAMAVFIGISIVLVFVISSQNRSVVRNTASTKAIDSQDTATLRESFRLVRSSPHLVTIAALILICSIATYVAGWQFKAILKQFIPDKHAIAAFLGRFYGATGVLAVLIQVFLTPRLLKGFGIGVALLILPLSFTIGTAAVIASGALWAAVLLRGTDKVVRYSIDTAALQLLYVPIARETKVQAKSFLDTVVLRGGDGLGAITVLLLTAVIGLNAAQVGWIVLVTLLLWITIARKAATQYVATLGGILRQHRIDVERLQELPADRFATQVLITGLRSDHSSKVISILELLEGRPWKEAYAPIRELLAHPAPEVRAKAIAVLRRLGDLDVVARVEELVCDPDLIVRTEALLFLAQLTGIDPLSRIQHLGDFQDSSIQAATLAFLGRSEDEGNLEAARLILESMIKERGSSGRRARLEAARLIQLLPDRFAVYLCQLLEDEDAEVLREAARTAGKRQHRQYVSPLIALLGHPEARKAASEALVQFGENVQSSLRDHLLDIQVPLEVKREIPDLLVKIAKRQARDTLLANLGQPDSVLRFRIISALNKLRHLYPDLELDATTIEAVLASEIIGHCRSYQIMGRMEGHLEQQSFNVPLQKSIHHELERIFRLLKMLYPRHDLQSAFVGLQSTQKMEHDSALEFIDNTLKPSIRRLVVPLVDGEISLREKVEFANRMLRSTIDSKDDALLALMNTQDPWLKSCAAHLIGILGLKQFQPEVDQWASDPDPVLREKAQRAQRRLAAYAS